MGGVFLQLLLQNQHLAEEDVSLQESTIKALVKVHIVILDYEGMHMNFKLMF